MSSSGIPAATFAADSLVVYCRSLHGVSAVSGRGDDALASVLKELFSGLEERSRLPEGPERRILDVRLGSLLDRLRRVWHSPRAATLYGEEPPRPVAVAFALAVMSQPPTEPGHVATSFAPHPHVIAAAPGHPLAGKRRVPLSRVAAEPLLAREQGSATRIAMDQAFAEAGVVPRIEMEIASNETIKQAAAAGLGVGFLSAHALRQELALGSLVILDVEGFPVMRQWYVVHRRDRRLPKIAQAFERFVLERGRELIGTDATRPKRGGRAK